MWVRLMYFLPGGQYLGEGKLWSDEDRRMDIIRLVRLMRDTGRLPGYSVRTSNIVVLIQLEDRDVGKVRDGWQPFMLPAVKDNVL